MPAISVRDNGNNRWKRNEKKQQRKTKKITKKEKNKGDRSYSERVRAEWFCCAFKFSPINKWSFFNF